MIDSRNEPIVGIDLGTSNCCVAVVGHDGSPRVLTDSEGRAIVPSVVSFHPSGKLLIGHEAKERRIIDPRNTVFSIKRLMGRRFASKEVIASAARSPFPIKEGPNEQPLIVTRGGALSPPEISALLLSAMRRIAETRLGTGIRRAVVTVPANFNDAQRQATALAGQIADLEVVRILNEPTAAALAYGYGKALEKILVVYDFGGGTFDVTILALRGDIFEVLATAGDTFLGGDDIDNRLIDFMVQAFLEQNRIDLRTDEVAVQRLRAVAEYVKCELSAKVKAVVTVEEIAVGASGTPIDLKFSMTREELVARVSDIVDRSFPVCDEALRLAGLAATQVDDVALVGGTTRIPYVRQRVAAYFGKPPRTDVNPDQAVALGAALQGASLSAVASGPPPVTDEDPTDARALPPARNAEEAWTEAMPVGPVLLDVTPRGLGIGTVGGYCDEIVQRNAQIPVEQTRVFTTAHDEQTSVEIRVCQGESRRFDDNTLLGTLVLDRLPARPRGEVRIAVTFEINTDGILEVSAKDEKTGQARSAQIRLLGMQSAEEVATARGRLRQFGS